MCRSGEPVTPPKALGCLLGVGTSIGALRPPVTDLRGTVLATAETWSNVDEETGSAPAGIFSEAEAILTQMHIPCFNFLLAGIDHSGGIGPHSGEYLCSHLPNHWSDLPLKILSERSGVACRMDGGTPCMTLAERRFEAARGADILVLTNVAQGTRSGLFIEAQLLRCTARIAGEVGGTAIPPYVPRYSRRNKGWLKILASTQCVVDAVVQALSANVKASLREITANDPSGVRLEAMCDTARLGDRLLGTIINHTAPYIGIAVANLINLIKRSPGAGPKRFLEKGARWERSLLQPVGDCFDLNSEVPRHHSSNYFSLAGK